MSDVPIQRTSDDPVPRTGDAPVDATSGGESTAAPDGSRPRGVRRRRFIGAVGGGLAASVGASRSALAQSSQTASRSEQTAAGSDQTAATRNQEPVTVSMGNDRFDPIGLHVEPGTTVRFEIADGSHSATAYPDRIPAGAEPFDSGVISTGAFEHTFDVPGTYDYYCTPHRSMGMVGRIVVGDPGGPATERPIPDGAVPESTAIVERGTIAVEAFESGAGAGTGSHSGGRHGGGRGRGGMMGSGHGMGEGPGWMLVFPIGFVTAALGVVGAAVYATRRQRTGGDRDGDAQ